MVFLDLKRKKFLDRHQSLFPGRTQSRMSTAKAIIMVIIRIIRKVHDDTIDTIPAAVVKRHATFLRFACSLVRVHNILCTRQMPRITIPRVCRFCNRLNGCFFFSSSVVLVRPDARFCRRRRRRFIFPRPRRPPSLVFLVRFSTAASRVMILRDRDRFGLESRRAPARGRRRAVSFYCCASANEFRQG